MEQRDAMRFAGSRAGRPFGWLCLCLAVAMASGGRLAAAEPPADEEPTVEIPAPVYVTLMLARDPAVQAELGLSRAQAAAVGAVVAKVDQPLWQLRDVPPERCGDRLNEHLATINKGLAAALSDAQRQRFAQLVTQARGSKALLAPDIQRQLQLSESQRGRCTRSSRRRSRACSTRRKFWPSSHLRSSPRSTRCSAGDSI